MSGVDKFLTDLASFKGLDSVTIEWRGYFHEGARFEVRVGQLDADQPAKWAIAFGAGATVDAALVDRISKWDAMQADKLAQPTTTSEDIEQ